MLFRSVTATSLDSTKTMSLVLCIVARSVKMIEPQARCCTSNISSTGMSFFPNRARVYFVSDHFADEAGFGALTLVYMVSWITTTVADHRRIRHQAGSCGGGGGTLGVASFLFL